MEEIKKVAELYNLPVIEDSVQGIGCYHHGKHAGTIGDVGVLGFFPNKQITTGEGGCIITDNREIATFCKQARKHGFNEDNICVQPGFNYKLSDVNCAIGTAQLIRLEELIGKRKAAYSIYKLAINSNKIPVSFPKVESYNDVNPFVCVVLLDKSVAKRTPRDTVLAKLREAGIGCRDYFMCVHMHPYYRKVVPGLKYQEFPIAEDLYSRAIALPFFSEITTEQIEYVVDNLKKILN